MKCTDYHGSIYGNVSGHPSKSPGRSDFAEGVMAETYKTVYMGGEGEVEEKKSRFIATVRPVHSEAEASAFIAEMKKKYWDARHNCSAFIVGQNSEIMRSSDDGEPSGTAGKPMLEVLLGEGLTDTAVVVTRYFGGTLLGTGGLIRAYTQATQEGLANSVVIEKRQGVRISMLIDYMSEGKVRYYLAEKGLCLEAPVYSDKAELFTVVQASAKEQFIKEITELLNGKAVVTVKEEVIYAEAEGEIILFEE